MSVHAVVCHTVLGSLVSLLPKSPGHVEAVRFEYREPHMGTQCRIVLYTVDEQSASSAARAAFSRIARLDAILSDYREDSELMQICGKSGCDPVVAGQELFTVLDRAQQLSRSTDGAFDVTVDPVVRLWRQARRQHRLPEASRLAEARSLVGYRNLVLDQDHRTVRLLRRGMRLDLGGIAKGYAADEAMSELKKCGVTSALVAMGGDIVVSAPPPDQEGWIIGVAAPGGVQPSLIESLVLHDAAVSTSGDSEQFVEIDGTRFSHIVDPRTGMAVVGRSNVTVTARQGIASDSLATAVSVLGPDAGLRLIESIPDAAALIVQATQQGQEIIESTRFKTLARRPATH